MKIKDIVKIKGGKRLPKGNNLQTTPNNHPYIRVRDMKGKYIQNNDLEYVPDAVFPLIKNYIVNENDVIVSIVGTIGLVSIIDKKLDNASQTENCAKLSGLDKIDAEYLYYYLISDLGQEEIAKATVGAVQPKLPLYGIENIDIDWKSRVERENIVSILKSFDDKIQLNTQTNQTLEAIAQAIFKSWFVDFDPVRAKAAALSEGKSEREANLSAMSVISGKAIEDLSQTEYQELWEIADAFPSEFGDEGLPIGWKFNQADNLFEVGIGKTPPRKETEWFSDNANDMEWISIKDMGNQGMFITESGEYLKAEAVDKFNIKKIPKNTVILSFKLTVGRVSITTKETTTNEAIAHFKIPSPSKLSSEFLYCYLKNFDFNNLGSTSSIATAVNSKMIKEMEILEPSDLVVKHFNEYIEGIFNKLRENIIQNNNLAKIRDELLPKLLSGEIEL